MSQSNYFWQGGRKIEIKKDNSGITIHADNVSEAHQAANEAGVDLIETESIAPGLVRANIIGDREQSVDKLRTQNNILHHVYRDQKSGQSEYLITESFFIKFKPDTPDNRILEYFTAENPSLLKSPSSFTGVSVSRDKSLSAVC